MKKRYKNIIVVTSLQFEGHLREYFVKNSEKTVALYILPRNGHEDNFIEFYQNGSLIEIKKLYSPKSLIASYITLYVQYLKFVTKYFSKNEKIYFINYHPIFFLGNSIIKKLIRNVQLVYMIGDYWPMNTMLINIYNFFIRHYHKNLPYAYYFTNRINKAFNGYIVNSKNKKTIMQAVDSKKNKKLRNAKSTITLCFIGVFVPWQGIELLLKVIAAKPNIFLKLIGTGEPGLVTHYKQIVKSYGIEKRVHFPNRFMYGKELEEEIGNSHIGIALYETDPLKVTYYADPSKIKFYIESGLPIIMTNTAEITHYIKKFKAGIVVKRDVKSIIQAIDEIKNKYKIYLKNVSSLAKAFDYNTYYQKLFIFLEEIK